VSYQEGLARVIAADAGGGGGLPVLEFTLTQLWPHQRGRQLTLAAYQAIGGVAGALSAHAEQAYQQLIGDFADDRIRRVMLALVRSRDGAATATRRTTTRRRLGEDWPVAQALAARRLLITGGDPAKGDETAEITHEALIREWPRLAAWVDDDAAFQRWLAAAEERAADGDLLPDTRLADADRWIGERDADVPPEVRQLVDQSKSAYLRRITELEQARARAEQALRESEARRLAAAVDVVLSTPGVSRQVPVALAVEALRLAPVLEADVAARHAIRAAARGITRLSCDGSPKAVWFGSRGPLLALVKDKEIQVLDVAAGSLTVRVPERLGVRVLAFSPDGSRLAIGSGGFMSDGDARVIDCASGAEIACFDHARPVQALGFSPDGTRVVTGSGGMLTHDAAARVFDIGAGTEIVRLEHSIEVLAVSFSPDGTRLATGTDGRVGLARVFDTTSWAETLSVTQAGEVRAVVFSPDGTRIATGGTSGVRIVSADTGGLTARLDHDYTVTALVFSPDGTRLATGSGHHFLGGGWATRVFDAVGGTEISRLDHDGDVSFLGFSPDSTRLAVGSYPDVWFLDASNGAEIARFPLERPVPASGLALTPDSTRAAFADIYAPDPADAAIRVADVAGGTEVARFRPDGIAATVAMALSPDGSRIAFATSTTSVYDGPGTTRVVDVATGTEVGRFDHDNTVFDLAFGPDGTQIALGGSHAEPRSHSSASTETQVFDISTGAEITRLEHPDRATALAFSPDGAKIVAGQHDGTVQVFDAADGTEILRVKHDEGVYAAAFSPDSSRVVAGTGHSQRRAGSARVLALATGAEIARFDHGDPVFAVAFSPDGTRAACGSRRGVRVFDTATGVETACPDDEHPVYHVAFSRDGTRLVGGDNNDGVRVWVIGRDQLIEQALSRLVRNLTVQEWHRYIPGQPYRKTHQELA
jgi:WD40 repeat protein